MGTSTGESSETAWAVPPAAAAWYSPMPYVFGGLAAMLGLIVVAVLLLVCSYWKRFQHAGAVSGNTNLEAGMRTVSNGDDCRKIAANTISEERVLVIMAGDDKPSFFGVAFGGVIPPGEHNRL
ncbi:protein GLUTAMINE DUMPER 4-like [Dioscorea cayenensis subsp. rotundata]|uniref:Protein GLUTAMINE DUMPER 4-like n=1 Tax=Dioscorea cayennensis subsp. rotundata TaxID=55577 RepID=A0AB40C0A9_DIOCR|nr:protein GLUTAMINE DUMPER 4-like [Dioscorea cayenensis subsp. rotundata]